MIHDHRYVWFCKVSWRFLNKTYIHLVILLSLSTFLNLFIQMTYADVAHSFVRFIDNMSCQKSCLRTYAPISEKKTYHSGQITDWLNSYCAIWYDRPSDLHSFIFWFNNLDLFWIIIYQITAHLYHLGNIKMLVIYNTSMFLFWFIKLHRLNCKYWYHVTFLYRLSDQYPTSILSLCQ